MPKPPAQQQRDIDKSLWAKQHGLVEYKGNAYLGLRFLNRKIPKEYDLRRFPGQDHTTYWNKDGQPHCIVSQPYHLSDDEMHEAACIARQWNLDICISAFPAWHYPGSVLFMEWKNA